MVPYFTRRPTSTQKTCPPENPSTTFCNPPRGADTASKRFINQRIMYECPKSSVPVENQLNVTEPPADLGGLSIPSTSAKSCFPNSLDSMANIQLEESKTDVFNPDPSIKLETNDEHAALQLCQIEAYQRWLSETKSNVSTTDGETGMTTNEHFQKWKASRKRAGLPSKVDKKLKKKKLNARLEKVLKPKNAFLIFNELQLKPEFKIHENIRDGMTKTYVAVLTLDGRTYTGEGYNMNGAKLIAADVALKDLFSKIIKNSESNDVTSIEQEGESKFLETDPVPWSTVGSYAMHLLFTRWQMNVPTTVTGPATSSKSSCSLKNSFSCESFDSTCSGSVPRPPRICNKLIDYSAPAKQKIPTVAETSQALYILNMVCPNIPVVENVYLNSIENRFQLQCKVDGVVYDVTARSKKEARRQLAVKVLKNYGVNFIQHTSDPVQESKATIATAVISENQ